MEYSYEHYISILPKHFRQENFLLGDTVQKTLQCHGYVTGEQNRCFFI